MRAEWHPGMSPPPDGDLVWIASEAEGTDLGYYDSDQHLWRRWTGGMVARPRWWARLQFPVSPIDLEAA